MEIQIIDYRIKYLRKQKGLTQRELAELAGIPRSSLSEIENRMMLPRQDHLVKIAKALGVNIDDLYR